MGWMDENSAATDQQLITEFVRGGAQGPFARIVQRHSSMVFGVCRSVLGNSADAEDAAQATFLTLAQKASSLSKHRSIAGWLHRVAWHIALRARQALIRRQAHERNAAASRKQMKAQSNESSRADLELLNEELNRLPDRYRAPIILHHLQGLTESEAASQIGCAVGTLSGRLSRGRLILRDRIQRRRSRAGNAGGALSVGSVASLFADQARGSVVPEGFENAVLRPATLVAAGRSAAAEAHVSARVAALARSAAQMLFFARLRFAAALVLIALLAGTGIAVTARHSLGQGGSRAVSKSGDLVGRIVDPKDQPVAGATIRVYTNRAAARANVAPLATTQSRDDGAFELTDVAASKGYFVLCFKQQPAFMHAEMDAVEVVNSQSKDLGTIRLVAGRY